MLAVVAALSVPARSASENGPPALAANSAGENDVAPAPSPKLSAMSAPGEDAAAEAALLNFINQSRQQAGVAPVRVDESLRQAARLHARRMVAARQLEHQLPGEPSLLQRIADVSPLPLDSAGENIANATCPTDAHTLLMHSPPHRENILSPQFNLVGVAALWSHGHLYIVQDFAHLTPSYSPRETARLVRQSVSHARSSAGLSDLTLFAPPRLDEAACAMAREDHPNARFIAASYSNRKVITYTQSRPEVLPSGAEPMLENPNLHHMAVGSCYARNAAYPTGIYWVAILLY